MLSLKLRSKWALKLEEKMNGLLKRIGGAKEEASKELVPQKEFNGEFDRKLGLFVSESASEDRFEVSAIREELFKLKGPKWFELSDSNEIDRERLYIIFSNEPGLWLIVRPHRLQESMKVIAACWSSLTSVVPGTALGFLQDTCHYVLQADGSLAASEASAHLYVDFGDPEVGQPYRQDLWEALVAQRARQPESIPSKVSLGQNIFPMVNSNLSYSANELDRFHNDDAAEQDFKDLPEDHRTHRNRVWLKRFHQLCRAQYRRFVALTLPPETTAAQASRILIRYNEGESRWLVLKENRKGTLAKVIGYVEAASAVVWGHQLGLIDPEKAKLRYRILPNGLTVETKRRARLPQRCFYKSSGYRPEFLAESLNAEPQRVLKVEAA